MLKGFFFTLDNWAGKISPEQSVLDQCILKQAKRILDDPSRMSCYRQAGGTEQFQPKWFRRHETWLESLFMLMIPTQQNKLGNSKNPKWSLTDNSHLLTLNFFVYLGFCFQTVLSRCTKVQMGTENPFSCCSSRNSLA